MRMRSWIFAAVVAFVLAINLGLVSLRIAQTGEETLRARVALASSALKGQLDLLDARLSPRSIAASPDVIEATRPPVDPTQPLGKPDERALRAAAAAVQPEPDLLVVASAQGAMMSRRAKPAQQVDDPAKLPLVKAGLEGNPAPVFATLDGALYRLAVARVPGNAAVVVAGMLIDDRLASQLRSQVDADVTIIQAGHAVASSLPAEERSRVARWSLSPAPGYGTLQVRVPLFGTALTGKLPRGATRYAVRGALVALDTGVQAALTVSASPYLGWLARYQAFYLAALVLFLLFGLVWGLVAPVPRAAAVVEPAAGPGPQPSLDVGGPRALTPAPAPRDVPWREGEGPSGEHPVVDAKPVPAARHDDPLDPVAPHGRDGIEGPLDPLVPPAGLHEATGQAAHAAPSPFAGDLFTPTPGQFSLAAEPAATHGEPGHADAGHEAAREPARAIESSAAKGDFSFAGLLDDAHVTPAHEAAHAPPPALDLPERTAPGSPSEALLARSRDEGTSVGYGGLAANTTHEYFPGDEPTRIEPVSAALLDKLREKDEPEALEPARVVSPPAAAKPALFEAGPGLSEDSEQTVVDAAPPAHEAGAFAAGGAPEDQPGAVAWPEEGAATHEGHAEPAHETHEDHAGNAHDGHAHDHAAHDHEAAPPGDAYALSPPGESHEPPAPAALYDTAEPAKDVTMTDFSMPPLEERDPDEAHWHETFAKFRELKATLGEPADRITFEKFSAKLRKNRADLLARHNCKGVRFSVYEKEGKAAIRASAIRE